MKKLLNVLLILAVLFTNLVPTTVLAAGRNTGSNGSITINNAVNGETYDIYRIFLVNSYDENKNIASYAVEEGWLDFINESKYFTLTDSVIDGVSQKVITASSLNELSEDEMRTFAKEALAYAKANSISKVDSKVAANKTAEFTGIALGYYLVDTSVGTLCSLDTTKPNATINEKNTNKPEDTKSIVEGQSRVKTNTAKIGDTVDYEIVVKNVANLSKVVARDTMEESLDLNTNSIVVTCEELEETDYTISATAHGFVIEFKDEALIGMTSDIVITYSAVLNENAEIAGEGNVNDFKVTYGNKQEIETASVTTYSYEMTLKKVTETGSALEGAKFELRKDGDLLNVVRTNDGYRIATAEDTDTTTTIVAGTVKISGLMNGTYELTETEAPEGFNKLGAPVTFTIEDANITPDSPFKVINTTGMILPSTGGMGTVLFITVGSVMALGFGVNLVTKARMRKIED